MRKADLPSGEEMLDALMMEWRLLAKEGNKGLTSLELESMCRSGIRKLLNGRVIPPSVMKAWIDQTIHIGLAIKQYGEIRYSEGGYILTEDGLKAAKLDPSDFED